MCETSATSKPEVIAQLVNKMRALIQEMKIVIEAVTEKLSKDPNNRLATSQKRQARPDKKSSGALTSEVTSVAGPLQTSPKRKTKGKPLPDRQGHGTKQEKNRSSSRMRTTPRKDRFESMEMEASTCQTGKIQMNTKMKNQEAHSKCPQEQSPIRIKHCNGQGSRTYSIEGMDSDTDRIVASLNLEEVLNNYNT